MSLRTLLKSKELSKEVIDEIMTVHGKAITAHIARITNLEKEKEELKSKYDIESKKWNKEKASLNFDRLVEKTMGGFEAIDEIETRAHLADFLKEADILNDVKMVEDLVNKLAELKESKMCLFVSNE